VTQQDTDKPPFVVALLKIEVPVFVKIQIAPSCEYQPEQDSVTREWHQDQNPVFCRHLAQVQGSQILRIGRSRSNDLMLDDVNVSRYHAILSASDSGVVISDLSSLNGTYVNQRRITTPLDLQNRDQVKIGESVFFVEFQRSVQFSTGDTSTPQTQNSGMKAVEMTVLLADICGYTKMSQALPAIDVAEALQFWFRTVNQIVKRHGGEVDKYIGDCVMALWPGSMVYPEQAAIAAARAAQEILTVTQQFSHSHHWAHHHDHPWLCRIALNTGTALSGSMGTREAREFAVLGDSINVAFRLEEVAGELSTDVILGEHTAELINAQIPVKSLGTIELEGRLGAVEVYTFWDQVSHAV
jgi:adenylate cyclase